ncbi:MAG: hypothetical protein OIF58_12305 [Cohaesibacter sp.]|nr:hypothetical protein [Cohaesibacter sp.]
MFSNSKSKLSLFIAISLQLLGLLSLVSGLVGDLIKLYSFAQSFLEHYREFRLLILGWIPDLFDLNLPEFWQDYLVIGTATLFSYSQRSLMFGKELNSQLQLKKEIVKSFVDDPIPLGFGPYSYQFYDYWREKRQRETVKKLGKWNAEMRHFLEPEFISMGVNSSGYPEDTVSCQPLEDRHYLIKAANRFKFLAWPLFVGCFIHDFLTHIIRKWMDKTEKFRSYVILPLSIIVFWPLYMSIWTITGILGFSINQLRILGSWLKNDLSNCGHFGCPMATDYVLAQTQKKLAAPKIFGLLLIGLVIVIFIVTDFNATLATNSIG